MNYGMTNDLSQFQDPMGGIPQRPMMGQRPPMPQMPIAQGSPMAPAMPDPADAIRNFQSQPPMAPGNFAPQAPIPQPMPPAPMPQPAPQAQPPMPMQEAPVAPQQDKVQAVAEAMPKAEAAMENQPPKPLEDAPMVSPYAQKRDSETPEHRLETIDTMGRAANGNLDHAHPEIKKDIEEVNKEYKLGEMKGKPIYSCPLTNKPCSQKTFWLRLKEFFLHSIGQKSQEEKDREIYKLDMKDPIVQKYGKGTEGKSIPKSQPQEQPKMAQSNNQFTPLQAPPISPYGQPQQQPNSQEEQFNPNHLPIPPVMNGVDYSKYNEGIA